jgi:periplasmic protein CpxP/Spy
MHRRLIFALAPAALAVATVAFAQPGPGPDGRLRHGGPPSEEMKARHEAMRKQHMEDLKTVLRLRPDQEAALAAFMASHEPQRFEMKLGDPKTLTTPQRLEQMAKHEEAMRAAHAKRRDALAKFYATLSPDQQKAFDALHRLQAHHGGGHGPGMMMGHGGPMMMHGGPGQERRVIIRRGGPGGPHDD